MLATRHVTRLHLLQGTTVSSVEDDAVGIMIPDSDGFGRGLVRVDSGGPRNPNPPTQALSVRPYEEESQNLRLLIDAADAKRKAMETEVDLGRAFHFNSIKTHVLSP